MNKNNWNEKNFEARFNDLKERLSDFAATLPSEDSLVLKEKGSLLQGKLLDAYWSLRRYLEDIDIVGFPVRLATPQTYSLRVRNSSKNIISNLKSQFSIDENEHSRSTYFFIPSGTLGVVLNMHLGHYIVGIYDAVGDKFIIRYTFRFPPEYISFNLSPEEKTKIKKAREKLLLRKYKGDNLTLVERLQETK